MSFRLAIALACVAWATGCSSSGDLAVAPDLASPTVAASTTVPGTVTNGAPEGFERVAATVTKADGEVCDVCLWFADTPALRSQGLMFVTELGEADGMVFVYPEPRTGTFWMKNTILPLSIAYFDADGRYLDEHDMTPCVTASCLRYRTSAGFQFAVETTQGDLASIGIEPGSTLELATLPCT